MLDKTAGAYLTWHNKIRVSAVVFKEHRGYINAQDWTKRSRISTPQQDELQTRDFSYYVTCIMLHFMEPILQLQTLSFLLRSFVHSVSIISYFWILKIFKLLHLRRRFCELMIRLCDACYCGNSKINNKQLKCTSTFSLWNLKPTFIMRYVCN